MKKGFLVVGLVGLVIGLSSPSIAMGDRKGTPEELTDFQKNNIDRIKFKKCLKEKPDIFVEINGVTLEVPRDSKIADIDGGGFGWGDRLCDVDQLENAYRIKPDNFTTITPYNPETHLRRWEKRLFKIAEEENEFEILQNGWKRLVINYNTHEVKAANYKTEDDIPGYFSDRKKIEEIRAEDLLPRGFPSAEYYIFPKEELKRANGDPVVIHCRGSRFPFPNGKFSLTDRCNVTFEVEEKLTVAVKFSEDEDPYNEFEWLEKARKNIETYIIKEGSE